MVETVDPRMRVNQDRVEYLTADEGRSRMRVNLIQSPSHVLSKVDRACGVNYESKHGKSLSWVDPARGNDQAEAMQALRSIRMR